jgi:hypothetical protein
MSDPFRCEAICLMSHSSLWVARAVAAGHAHSSMSSMHCCSVSYVATPARSNAARSSENSSIDHVAVLVCRSHARAPSPFYFSFHHSSRSSRCLREDCAHVAYWADGAAPPRPCAHSARRNTQGKVPPWPYLECDDVVRAKHGRLKVDGVVPLGQPAVVTSTSAVSTALGWGMASGSVRESTHVGSRV